LIASLLVATGVSAIAAPQAGQIAVSAGSSSFKGELAKALSSLCPGQFVEFTDGSPNVSTYFCAASGSFANAAAPKPAEYIAASPVSFSGTAYPELRLNVNGGSLTAVCQLAGWPSGTSCPAPLRYWDPASAGMALPPAGANIVGGIMDIEQSGYLDTVRAGIANPPQLATVGLAQTFGVAVSGDLYGAMFNDQFGTTVSLSCSISDTRKPECVPLIGKAQMAAIMSANSSNEAYAKGANFLSPSLPNPSPMTYARRVDTSGTQAVAQQYFLGNVCNNSPVAVVAADTSANAITVTALPSGSDVRYVLNASGYAIGVMPGTNNQSGQSWKWIRVAGIAMADSAEPADTNVIASNTVSARNGTYDFWYIGRIAQPAKTGQTATFWTKVKAALLGLTTGRSAGIFPVSETKYYKFNSCTPVSQ
jgi:hypothetical protein